MKRNGNISILVIFVLLASSLLGVLSMNFVQSMMKQSATVYNYYQSYYLAKAGVELGLAELGHRGIGFEQIFSDSGFVSNNFLCAGRCDIQLVLSGTATTLSQQSQTQSGCQSPFVLSGGASLIVPLFRDPSIGSLSEAFAADISYVNLYSALQSASIDTSDSVPVTFGMVVLSGEALAANGIFFQKGNLQNGLGSFLNAFDIRFRPLLDLTDLGNENILPYRFFFMISNSSEQQISFCLASTSSLPTQQYYLKSRGTYDHQKLGLEALYKQPIPDFLLNGYINY